MSRVERVAAHVGQIHALLQCIINECDAAQTEVFDYLYMSDAANKQSEKLKAENAKLKELCERAAIELYVNGNVTDAATKNLLDEMRELGIEVKP